jgi:hypothetical protein
MTKKRTAENEIVVSSGAAAAQTRRKAPARPRAGRTATPDVRSALAVGSEASPETSELQPVAAAIIEATVVVASPSQEEVAKLAYLYWEARGCQGGSPEEDWLRAEQELLARR